MVLILPVPGICSYFTIESILQIKYKNELLFSRKLHVRIYMLLINVKITRIGGIFWVKASKRLINPAH